MVEQTRLDDGVQVKFEGYKGLGNGATSLARVTEYRMMSFTETVGGLEARRYDFKSGHDIVEASKWDFLVSSQI